jgi:hypothetical protein
LVAKPVSLGAWAANPVSPTNLVAVKLSADRAKALADDLAMLIAGRGGALAASRPPTLWGKMYFEDLTDLELRADQGGGIACVAGPRVST